MTQRFEGRSVEEALAAAAAGLGVERHELMHRVVEEKRGFLGSVKHVVIEAEANEAAPAAGTRVPSPDAAAASRPTTEPAPVRTAAPVRERGRARGQGGRRDGRGRGRSDGPSGNRRGGRQHESDLKPGDFAQFLSDELPPQEPESASALIVRAWCDKVLALGRFDVVLRTHTSEGRIDVTLFGPDSHRFLERNGELLDAFQVLANKALVGRKIDEEIELDCGSFKERREADIVRRAHEAAALVREQGVEQLLPVMAPVERRMVHVALENDPDVTTISRGDGFYKRVAVVPKPAATDPEP